MFRQAKKIVVFLLILIILSCSFCFGVAADSWPVIFETKYLSDFLSETPRTGEGTCDVYWEYRNSNKLQPYIENPYLFSGAFEDSQSIMAFFPDIVATENTNYKFRIPLRTSTNSSGFLPDKIAIRLVGPMLEYFYNCIVDFSNELTVDNLILRDFIFEGTLSAKQINEMRWIEIQVFGSNGNLIMGVIKGDSISFKLSGDLNSQYIVDNQQQMQEEEKNQANSTGQEGVDQIGSLIPSDTDGLISAFTKLTQSMIHNDTTCKIDFPGIKIPKLVVQGIEIGNVTLLEPREIDFEYYFTLIPEIYLKLIRALCTIALIVYCFKEMYSLLSFIFTAKGGGDSE